MNYEKIAEYCKTNWKEFSDHIVRIADEVSENKFIFDMEWDMERTYEIVDFKDKIDWDYRLNGDPEFTWQFNRHRFLIILGQAYKLTDNVKYVKSFVRLINDWIDNYPQERDKFKNCGWRVLEVGLRGEYWTKAMEYFKDSEFITGEFFQKFASSLVEHAELLKKTNRNHSKTSNWGVIQDHGMLAIALYLGEKYLSKDFVTIALERLTFQIKTQLIDGVHWEQSPMYHTEVLLCFLDAIIRLQKNKIDIPSPLYDNAKRMAEIISLWKRPNHHQPMMGDSDDTDVRDILSMCALIFNDGRLKSEGREILDFESAWLFGEEGIAKYNEIKTIPIDKNSIDMSASGNFFLRTDNGENANYLHFITGFTGGGHAHSDKLHFDLTINGEDVLTDCGRYTYMPTKMRHYLKSPKAHNTVTVDNVFFIKNLISAWAYSKLAPSIVQPMTETSEAILLRGGHLGYLSRGVYTERKILWIKPNIYVIIDSFKTNSLHSYQTYFNFKKDARLSVVNNRVDFIGEKAKASMFFMNEKSKIKIQEGFISHNYNKIEKNQQVKTSRLAFRNNSAITVIIGGKKDGEDIINVSKIPVFNAYNHKVRDAVAEGLKINYNDKEYVLISAYKECFGFLHTDEKIGGLGSLLLFEKNKGKLLNIFG